MKEAVALAAPIERAERIVYPADRRLGRMRFLSRLMDNSVTLPGGYRIGLDPLLGLVPALGDLLAATLSLWLIYDAARLGVSKRTLARMGLNVLLDSSFGSVPVLGDVFDALWKANSRNMRLVEAEYQPALKPRSFARIGGTFLLILLAVYGVVFAAVYLAVKALLGLF